MKIKMISAKLGMSALILASLCAPALTAQEHFAKAEQKAATVAEAKKFLDDAEAQLFDLGNKQQRAAWVQENFITDDTNQIAADAGEVVNTLTVELAKKAHRFDALKLPPEMARKMLLVKLSIGFPAPSNPAEQKELAAVSTSL